MTPENRAKLKKLEQTDGIVRNCIQCARTTNMSREDTLVMVIVNLHEAMETYKNLCIQYSTLTGISPKT